MSSREIVVRIDRKTLIFLAALLLIAALSRLLWSEALTLVTTYPAPSGIYNTLVTTGDSGSSPSDTTLNRNAGHTILVPPSNAGGRVGIGTTSPASKLEIIGTFGATSARFTGSMQVGDDPSACTAAKAGTLRWRAGKLEGCNGSTWKL
jgi:hypothetical protein